MDGRLGGLYDLIYLSGDKFKGKKDRIKNWKGEVLTEDGLRKILVPLEAGNPRQIEAIEELQFLYDCREHGEPIYKYEIMDL